MLRSVLRKSRFVLCISIPLFSQSFSLAQVAQGIDSGNVASGASEQAIPPAIQKELDAMKRRIEELEAQLAAGSKVKSTTDSTGKTAATEAGANTSSADISGATAPALSSKASVPSTDNSSPATPAPGKEVPFAFADWTWLNGNARTKTAAFDSTFFTPEIRADVDYIYDFNHPKDDTIGGSSEVFRSDEIQVTQLGVGGDFHYDNVRARLMTQFGLYSVTTPRNDASPSRGQWDLRECVPLFIRSLWRISLRCFAWNQRGRRNFHVLCRPLQLLQL
jgi:hypothetical protein